MRRICMQFIKNQLDKTMNGKSFSKWTAPATHETVVPKSFKELNAAVSKYQRAIYRTNSSDKHYCTSYLAYTDIGARVRPRGY